MSKNTSPAPLRAFRYGVGYVEKYFKFAWSQTGWVWSQAGRYFAWVKRQNIHPGFRVPLYFLLIVFPFLWIVILLFGFLRSV